MSSFSRLKTKQVSSGIISSYSLLYCCVYFLLLLSVHKNGWQIISPKKSFAVFAATPTEKAEWMAHINKCIADLLTKSEVHY